MPEPRTPPPLSYCALQGAVLAFDFGLKRTGVAAGDLTVGIAHPLRIITAEAGVERFNAIAALVAEWQPALLVVGLPRHMDGGEHDMTRRCARFARQLEGRFQVPAALVDERLTSLEATRRLADIGARGARHRQAQDAVAAALILQAFFDARRHPGMR